MSHPDPDFEDSNEPDPDDFLPVAKQKNYLAQRPDAQSFQMILWVCILFIAFSVMYWTYDVGKLFPTSFRTSIQQREYWRLWTAIFVHADPIHLLSNAPLFIIFGWMLRFFYGSIAFPITSMLIGVLTNFVTIQFYPQDTWLLGASGMVYGMVGLWIVFYIRFDIFRSIFHRSFRAIGFSLMVMFPSTFHQEVSYISHAVGFGLGLVFGVLLIPFFQKRVDDFNTSA